MAEARLDKARLDNDSVGVDVVSAHNELEGALSKILGVPTGVQINSPVFGSVQSDGALYRIRWSDKTTASSAEGASGFEFRDGVVRKRVVLSEGNVQVWEADTPASDTTSWTLLHDFEDEEAPALTELEDVNIQNYTTGLIVGVKTQANGSLKFELMEDQVVNDGMKKFIDMSDVSSSFKAHPVLHGFDTDKIGWFVGVSDTKTLIPIPPGDDEADKHIEARGWPKDIGRVGILGGEGQDWTLMNWKEVFQGSTITTFETLNGVTNAGIELDAGVWRVMLNYHVVTGMIEGFISWKMIGAQTFPVEHNRQHMPYMRYDNEGSVLEPWDRPPAEWAPGGWGSQEQYLIVPETTTVGLMMGRESAQGANVVPVISIARII